MGLSDRDYARARTSRPTLRGPSRLSFNSWLIIANVGVFAVELLLRMSGSPGIADLIFQWGHFSTAKAFFFRTSTGMTVMGLEVWRFLTFQFLHANWVHLFFNMFGLWMFGGWVEERLGFKRYAAFYLLCGIFGAIVYLLLNLLGSFVSAPIPGLLFENPHTPLIGASAGVFGVLMAAAYYYPNAPMQIIFLPFVFPLKYLAYGYVALSAYNLIRHGHNAGGDAAHIGGALAGYYFIRRPHHLGDFFDVLGPPRAKKAPRRPPVGGASRPSGPDTAEVDRILAKVSEQGVHSLSDRERDVLNRATKARRS